MNVALEATKINYYALFVAIFRTDLTADKALKMMGLLREESCHKKVSSEERKLYFKMFDEGMTIHSIAKEFGRSFGTVQNAINMREARHKGAKMQNINQVDMRIRERAASLLDNIIGKDGQIIEKEFTRAKLIIEDLEARLNKRE